MRKLFLLPALLLCLGATPALSLSDSPYVARGAFDAVNLLPPPPESNSAEQKRDVERVLQIQKTSTPERMQLAQDDAKIDLSRFAQILGPNLVPEKRRELFARGWDYGESRVVGGVHFPTDVESGRILATAMVALMMQNAEFRADLAAARVELRRSLGLSQ